MSEKKRKAAALLDTRPKKKQQADPTITVGYVKGGESLKPIIATPAGPLLPNGLRYQSFSRQTPQGHELLIYSSDHPTIDYTAAEGAEYGESFLKHYVGIYDPVTNTLKLTESKKMIVRGSVRQEKALEADDNDEDYANIQASQGTRAALTEAFGSKKSKKAAQSVAENRQLGQGLEGATIAEAITSNMVEDDDEDADTSSAVARSSKPLPPANTTTDDIEDVYAITKIVVPQPASKTLREMHTDAWKAKLQANEAINLRTRFVANRVAYVGKRAIEDESPKMKQQLQLLRYIELLIEITQYCGTLSRRRKMDFVDQWPENTLSPGISTSIVKQVVNHFFPDNTPSERAMTLLRTTILALTLHIVPPSGRVGEGRLVAEPTDIQLDLAMSESEVRKYYHELGCKVAPATDRDLVTFGYQKIIEKRKKKSQEGQGQMPKPTFAILKFPLNFPKLSMGRAKR